MAWQGLHSLANDDWNRLHLRYSKYASKNCGHKETVLDDTTLASTGSCSQNLHDLIGTALLQTLETSRYNIKAKSFWPVLLPLPTMLRNSPWST
jgi:hypothetical protein